MTRDKGGRFGHRRGQPRSGAVEVQGSQEDCWGSREWATRSTPVKRYPCDCWGPGTHRTARIVAIHAAWPTCATFQVTWILDLREKVVDSFLMISIRLKVCAQRALL